MIVELNTAQPFVINWTAKGLERILQNVMNLLNTIAYEVAYDRTLGLKRKFLDMPLDQAIVQATIEIIDTVEKYEPRVKVKKVNFQGVNEQGIMDFKVVMEVE